MKHWLFSFPELCFEGGQRFINFYLLLKWQQSLYAQVFTVTDQVDFVLHPEEDGLTSRAEHVLSLLFFKL